jgi:hypothetical protein
MAPFRAPEPAVEAEDEEEYFPFGGAALRPAPPAAQDAPQPAEPEPLPFAAPSQVEEVDEAEDEPLAFIAPSQVVIEQAAPEEVLEDEPAEQPVAAAAPEPEPREPLDGLSMVDLAERLAKSLGKHGGSIAPPAGLAAALGMPVAAPVEPARTTELEPLPEPELAEEPEEEAEDEEIEAPRSFDKPTVQLAPPAPVIPEALRPIPLDLEEFGEDEDDLDLSLSFGAIRAPAPKAPPPGAQVFIADKLDGEEELDEDEEANEQLSEFEGYSSLLAMKSPFRGPAEYVRIEQPEPEEDVPAEPAVIFPGQQANGQMPAPAPAPAPFAAPEAPAEPQIRRFDAPGNVAPIEAAPANRPKVDRDEAERSLRSALATLQRMSGAA